MFRLLNRRSCSPSRGAEHGGDRGGLGLRAHVVLRQVPETGSEPQIHGIGRRELGLGCRGRRRHADGHGDEKTPVAGIALGSQKADELGIDRGALLERPPLTQLDRVGVAIRGGGDRGQAVATRSNNKAMTTVLPSRSAVASAVTERAGSAYDTE
jgi:hypothetical protein